MEAASQNNSALLASLISGQGAVIPSQRVDNSSKSVNSSFLSSLDVSSQAIQNETANGTTDIDTEGLLQAVNELLTANAANAATEGLDLTQPGGQGFAADMSNEEIVSVISQLQGAEGEALAGTLGLASAAQQNKPQVEALFSKNSQLFANTLSYDSLSQLSKTTLANVEAVSQLAQQSQTDDRGLLERLNAVQPQPSQMSDVAKLGDNYRQVSVSAELGKVTENSLSFSNLDTAKDAPARVVTPVPVLLERMAAMSNEGQLNAGFLDLADSANASAIVQPGKAEALQSSMGSRPVATFIHSPLSTPQWQSEFNDKIMMLSRVSGQGHNQVAEIRLIPAHLGPIEVRVAMKDDQASILFSAQHGAVRDAIEASLPRLREMFNTSGLMLADANVSEQSLQERHNQDQNKSGGQYANADAASSMNEQVESISQINLSAIPSSAALDLYA